MPEDYYGDGDAPAAAGDGNQGDDQNTDNTAVVPSELCPGMKVGDRMEVEIVGVDDDSYQIKYLPEKKEEAAEQPASAPAPEGSMASMME